MDDAEMTVSAPSEAQAQPPADEMEFHWRRGVIAIAGIFALITLFYMEENWRGKRAWEHYKQSIQARGETVDWAAYFPAPVPDEQNFFDAPRMSGWFVGRGGSSLSGRLTAGRDDFLQQRDTNPLVELTVVSTNAVIPPDAADAVLQFKYSVLSLAPLQENTNSSPEPRPEAIPLIVMDAVPLGDAVKNLARQMNLNYYVDPATGLGQPWQPTISLRWTNLTAEDALVQLLRNYNLQLIPNATAVARIIRRNPGDPDMCVAPTASRQIAALLRNAIASATNGACGPDINSAVGFTVFLKSPGQIKPARIFVRADKPITPEEITEFFPKQPNLPPVSSWSRPHVELAGNSSNSFRIWYNPAPYTAAADYLEWTDQFKSEFDQIRDALKRPYAQLIGSYQEPADIPIPNFITVRIVAQTLADRADCHLLMGQPDLAWRDLSLIRELCRLLEGRPTGRPMTLVAAMINVAVTGLYVDVVEEGLRLNAWQDAQLAAIEEQLKQVNLPAYVAAAFDMERVASCHRLEKSTPDDWFRQMSISGNTTTNLWHKLKDPPYLFLSLAPRGWIYQNMTSIGVGMQETASTFDVKDDLILPRRAEALGRLLAEGKPFRPFTFLANFMVPNFTRALQTCARNQTLANEALVVCALERHRLAHGNYPETLDSLAPRFLDKPPHDLIGGQPLKYRPTPVGQFVLYSVGWNEKDDGGAAGKKDPAGFDADQGDWVWPYRQRLIK